MTPNTLRIATRKSALALWQAEHVAARLRALAPDRPVELLPMSTEGDRNLGLSLAAAGGKGLFVKELETALADGRVLARLAGTDFSPEVSRRNLPALRKLLRMG